ncbi:hypothetical protein O1Q96_00595 (plasmid) [Streptomyces sp. Qhu-G9]|uniref:hypothetical protein n=1 Tax=Streptomyces sp. Qhu-G9 TaxID=3452799 RepID=UPI0022ABD11B|nr:hypothetical protein [Streptomyces aurantiacus]WAU78380.1 hypothetical protein O1Q96_00595 [Streptomyces aurantiacus]
MASAEGSSGRWDEVVETDLTRSEGLPSQRGRSVDGGGIAKLQQGSEAGLNVSGWFRDPFNVASHDSGWTGADERSPTDRRLLALLSAALGPLFAVVFGWVFLESAVPDTHVFALSGLMAVSGIALSWYLVLRPGPKRDTSAEDASETF